MTIPTNSDSTRKREGMVQAAVDYWVKQLPAEIGSEHIAQISTALGDAIHQHLDSTGRSYISSYPQKDGPLDKACREAGVTWTGSRHNSVYISEAEGIVHARHGKALYEHGQPVDVTPLASQVDDAHPGPISERVAKQPRACRAIGMGAKGE